MTVPANFASNSVKDEILGQWLARLAETPDPQPLLAEFASLHPDWLSELQDLVALDRKARQIGGEAVEPAGPRLRPGQRLGPFAIIRQVAVGGMGEIYEAEQVGLNRRVAVKVIRHGRASEIARLRFRREQQVLARLHQSHIVPIYASGEDENLEYFAMPFIRGVAVHDLIREIRDGQFASLNRAVPSLTVIVQDYLRTRTSKAPARAPGAPIRFSNEYYRSVAAVMAQAADGVQAVHQGGIVHRDIKPSNLMVDAGGHAWIIDFGLAGLEVPTPSPETAATAADGLTQTQGLLGTLSYMAPEQLNGGAEPRSDVWGLGATLYELLTLERAFDGRSATEVQNRILTDDLPSIRGTARHVPRDLEEITRKALSKDPARRYDCALSFANDLRAWLNLRPTQAHPDQWLRPLGLFLRRNWSVMLPIVLATLVSAGLLLMRYLHVQDQKEQRYRHSEERQREAKREALLQQLQYIRLSSHGAGWSAKAWELVQQATALNPDGMRDYAAATLEGWDARVDKYLISRPAGGVAFHPDRDHLLIGSWEYQSDPRAPVPPSLWTDASERSFLNAPTGTGTVTWDSAGRPVQLFLPRAERPTLLLWDLERGSSIREIPLPAGIDLSELVATLAPSGRTVAASFPIKERAVIRVWDVASGKQLHEFEGVATALAFAPNNELLAAGCPDGRTTVWSMADGAARVQQLAGGRGAILSVAFGRAPQRTGNEREPNYLLATGDGGGAITIWHLASGLTQCRCHGSPHNVTALAFSPDGMLLASAGRYDPMLWDTVTGRRVMELSEGAGQGVHIDFATGISFSRDGRRLAVSCRLGFDNKGKVAIFGLESGRCARQFFGLGTTASRFCFSPDSRYLAASGSDWRIGIWDLHTDRLLHLLDGPKGLTPDNAALAFDAEGKRFASASGRGARLWDVASGRVLGDWDNQLPPALCDSLAFDADGALLLLRAETEDGSRYPRMSVDPQKHPRVFRLRNLLGPDPLRPRWILNDCNTHVLLSRITPDGRTCIVYGKSGERYVTLVVDADTGKDRWEPADMVGRGHMGWEIDPTGRLMTYSSGIQDSPRYLFDLRARRLIGNSPCFFGMPGPNATFFANTSGPTGLGVQLHSASLAGPVVTFSLDRSAKSAEFSPDGRLLVWAASDAGITVMDIEAARRKLAELGLGW